MTNAIKTATATATIVGNGPYRTPLGYHPEEVQRLRDLWISRLLALTAPDANFTNLARSWIGKGASMMLHDFMLLPGGKEFVGEFLGVAPHRAYALAHDVVRACGVDQMERWRRAHPLACRYDLDVARLAGKLEAMAIIFA